MRRWNIQFQVSNSFRFRTVLAGLLGGWVLFVQPHNLSADEFSDFEEIIAIEKDEQDARESRLLKNPMRFFDRKKRQLAKKVVVLSNALDSVFGGDNQEGTINKSRIKITYGRFFEEYEDPAEIFDLSTSIVLPNTEKRLHFMLESLNEDVREGKHATAKGLTNKGDVEQKNYAAGLRYIPKAPVLADYVDLSLDGGIRVNWPLQTFAKIRARKSIPQAHEFFLKLYQEFAWFDREGWASDSKISYERALKGGKYFSFSNDLHWQEEWSHSELSHTVSLFHPVTKKDYFTYWVGSTGELGRGVFVNIYGAGISYRRPVYKSWLFLQISPGGQWAKENNFEYRTVLEARLEAIVSE